MEIIKNFTNDELRLRVEFNTHDLTKEETEAKQIEAVTALETASNHYIKEEGYKIVQSLNTAFTNPNRESRGRKSGEPAHVWFEAFLTLGKG